MEEALNGLYASWAIVAAIFSAAGIVSWELHKWDKSHEARHTKIEDFMELHDRHAHHREGDPQTFIHRREGEM